MELIDVLDTAVKVGLGALISGLTTFYATREKNNHDRRSEAVKKKHDLLLRSAEGISAYMDAFAQCISRVDGLLRHNVVPGTFPTNLKNDYLEDSDKLLVKARSRLRDANVMLRLIGEKRAFELTMGLTKSEDDFREPLVFGKGLPTHEELNETRKALGDAHAKLQEELTAAYNRISS